MRGGQAKVLRTRIGRATPTLTWIRMSRADMAAKVRWGRQSRQSRQRIVDAVLITVEQRDAGTPGQATILPRKRCQPRAAAKCAASRGGAPADAITSVMSSPRLMTSGTSAWARQVPKPTAGGVGRLLGCVSRLEARGAGPDQRGDEPEVTPVQRVHERTVQEI